MLHILFILTCASLLCNILCELSILPAIMGCLTFHFALTRQLVFCGSRDAKIKWRYPIELELLGEEFIEARFGGQRPGANLVWCLCTHLCRPRIITELKPVKHLMVVPKEQTTKETEEHNFSYSHISFISFSYTLISRCGVWGVIKC